MRKSIAIDMDNVIADVESQYLTWYHQHYGVRMEKDIFHGVPEMDAFPEKDAVYKFLFMPGFFRSVPVMPGAQQALQRLMENFDVYIVSAAMEFPQSLTEKYQWLQEYFPFIHWRNIIFCGDKSIIDTDYMIDDHVKNLDCCKGKAIIFTAGHNIKLEREIRVNNWEEAVAFLEAELTMAKQ